jgi:hypothetical protein
MSTQYKIRLGADVGIRLLFSKNKTFFSLFEDMLRIVYSCK